MEPKIAAVVRHVRDRISQTPVGTHPFPHLEVDGLLPPEYYRGIRQFMPAGDAFRIVDKDQNFEFDPLAHPPQGTAEFWRPFSNEVSRAILAASLEKFADTAESYLAFMRQRSLVSDGWNLGRVQDERSGTHTVQIFRRRGGYSSAPHYHNIREFITCLYYLPDTADHAHLGTDLYQITDAYRLSWDQLTKYSTANPKCVRIAKVSRYLPNRALIYLNTPWAVHGNTMREMDYDRWLSLITLTLGNDMLARLPPLLAAVHPITNRFGLDVSPGAPFMN